MCDKANAGKGKLPFPARACSHLARVSMGISVVPVDIRGNLLQAEVNYGR